MTWKVKGFTGKFNLKYETNSIAFKKVHVVGDEKCNGYYKRPGKCLECGCIFHWVITDLNAFTHYGRCEECGRCENTTINPRTNSAEGNND